MAVTSEFYKSKAIEYLDAVCNRKPIQSPPTNISEVLTLGAVCFFVARTFSFGDWPRVDFDKTHREVAEAKDSIRHTEALGAFEFLGTLCGLIYHGKYDAEFEEHVQYTVSVDGDQPIMKFQKGQKKPR